MVLAYTPGKYLRKINQDNHISSLNSQHSKQKCASYCKLSICLFSATFVIHFSTGSCNMVEPQYLPCDNMALAMVGSTLSDTTLVNMSTENGGVQSNHKAER